MKQLIEDYKKRLEAVETFINESCICSQGNQTWIKAEERASCYRTFISELESIKKQESQREDFALYDLSGIPQHEKDILINDFSILTSTNALKVYKSLGLKDWI